MMQGSYTQKAGQGDWLDAVEPIQADLEAKAESWQGSMGDWRQFLDLLNHPVLATSLDPALADAATRKVAEACGVDRGWKALQYTEADRERLDEVLRLPCARLLLGGGAEVEPKDVLLAAAAAEEGRIIGDAVFWDAEIAGLRADVQRFGSLEVVARPSLADRASGIGRVGSVMLREEDFAHGRLAALARRMLGIKGDAELPQPAKPMEPRLWFNPERWRAASSAIAHFENVVRTIFGVGGLQDLPRLLEHAASVRPESGELFHEGSKIASRLFTAAEGDVGLELREVGRRFDRLLRDFAGKPEVSRMSGPQEVAPMAPSLPPGQPARALPEAATAKPEVSEPALGRTM